MGNSPRRMNTVTSVVLAVGFAWPLLFTSCRGSIDREVTAAEKSSNHPDEEEVTFQSGDDTLHGTIFWPASRGAAIVILAGSDRSKRGPLRIRLAKHFSAQNVAALVYDSPGTGGSTGMALLQTRGARVAEALSAVSFLRTKSGVPSDSVGLFGGSEGADVALMAGASDSRVKFVVAVSGAMGVPILDLLRYSAEKKGHDQGLSPDEILKAITFKEVGFVLLGGIDILEWSLIESRVKQWNDNTWTALIEAAKNQRKNLTAQQKESLLKSLRHVVQTFKDDTWFGIVDPEGNFQRLVTLDANTFFRLIKSGRYTRDGERSLRRDLQGIQCPILAIWGEQDSFLPPNQSAMRLKDFLVTSNHTDYRIKIFEDASHYLTVAGPDSKFTPGYLELVTDWLDNRVRPDRSNR